MQVKCKSCKRIVNSDHIGDKGGTGKKDVIEMWDDGSVIHADFIGECPQCFKSKSLFDKVVKKYIINEKELKELIKDSCKLNALENGGVDNWEWYGEALEEYNDEEEIDFSSYKEYKGGSE